MRELDAQSEFPVSEDSNTFCLLLNAIYSEGARQTPIWMHNVETLLELARKYDITSVTYFCDQFLDEQEPQVETLGKLYRLADTYHLAKTTKKCRDYAAAEFRRLTPDWWVPFAPSD